MARGLKEQRAPHANALLPVQVSVGYRARYHSRLKCLNDDEQQLAHRAHERHGKQRSISTFSNNDFSKNHYLLTLLTLAPRVSLFSYLPLRSIFSFPNFSLLSLSSNVSEATENNFNRHSQVRRIVALRGGLSGD